MKKHAQNTLKWTTPRRWWQQGSLEVLNTQEKSGLKNRADQEPSAPGSPEKLVYKFIKGFQEPFFSVDVRT